MTDSVSAKMTALARRPRKHGHDIVDETVLYGMDKGIPYRAIWRALLELADTRRDLQLLGNALFVLKNGKPCRGPITEGSLRSIAERLKKDFDRPRAASATSAENLKGEGDENVDQQEI